MAGFLSFLNDWEGALTSRGSVGRDTSEVEAIKAVLPAATVATAAPVVASSGIFGTIASALTPVTSAIGNAAKSILSIGKNAYINAFTTAPLKTTAQTAVAGIVGTTILKSSKGREAVVNAPASIDKFTTNAAALIDEPTMANAEKLYKDTPVLTGGLTIGGLTLAGLGLTGVASNILNTKAVRENTKIMLNGTGKTNTQAAIGGTNENDVKLAKITAENNLALAKEQTKQAELNSKALTAKAAVPPAAAPMAATPIKATKKKKKATKKKKKAPKKKKKAKTIKRKTPKKKKKVSKK